MRRLTICVRLLSLVALTTFGLSALGDFSSVCLIYNYTYQVGNSDPMGDIWDTGPENAWASWWFAFQGAAPLFPLKMSVTSATPIAVDAWPKPEFADISPPSYSWNLEQPGAYPEVRFQMEDRPVLDPGVVITRRMSPELVEPGESLVRASVEVLFIREPVLRGNPYPRGRVDLQVWARSAPDLEILGYRLVTGGLWVVQEGRTGFGAPGVQLRVGQPELGSRYAVEVEFRVLNVSGHVLRFAPVVALLWDPAIPDMPSSFELCASSTEGAIPVRSYRFTLYGPDRKPLSLSIEGSSFAYWSHERVGVHSGLHAQLCARWGQVVERR